MKPKQIAYILSALAMATSLCACAADTPADAAGSTTGATTTVSSPSTEKSAGWGSTSTAADEGAAVTASKATTDQPETSGGKTNTTVSASHATTTTRKTSSTTASKVTAAQTTATAQATPPLPTGVKAVITLSESPKVLGSGVVISGKTVTITAPGTYRIAGQMTDGQIVVNDAAKAENITLQLNGVTLINAKQAPVYVQNAEKVIFTTLKGTVNTITDNRSAVNSDNAACIYADDDITFNGEGKLVVNGNYNNGIRTKNDLKITAGTVEVTAAKNGLRGNDSVEIQGGTLRVTCGKDGIKSSETANADKGFILVSGGNITVTAGDDAMQAPRRITVSGGQCVLSAVGKLYKCDTANGISIKDGCVTEV